MEFRRIREIKESVKSEKEKLSDTQYWLKFLQTSSYHYKHSFDDQIMINLQNPQFTACSDARSWRSLSREPQGHGVPTLHNGKIRYLFDITQTSAPKGTPLPWVWEINDNQLNIDYSESVSKHLTEKYNLDSETLEEQLYDITLMCTAKYLNDDKSDLYKVVAESAAYSLLYRCCPGEAQPSPKNLTGLSKYPIEEIGQAVTEISKSIFLEIESIVRSTRHNAIEEIRRNEHDETRENDRRSETRSESQDRGISSGYGNLKGMDVRFGRGEFPVLSDLSEGSSYRSDIGSGKERISGNGSGIGKTIGGGKRDSGIHGSGVRHSTGRNERELLQDGIGVLETNSGGTSSGDPSREVRNNAQELSSQSGHQGIYMAEKQRSTEQTSDSRQSSGTRDGRYDSGKTQGEQSGIQRSGESGRLPENSTASEQFSENSRGRNSDRTDIQIIGNTPYRYIPQKTYRKYDTDIAAKIADKLGESGIKFSGKITAETTTITVSKADIERLEEIANSFTAEKEKFAIGESHKQSHEVQLSRAEFIEYATDKLINDITVRNAHENSDLENFNNEINKSISELFTELIVGKEQIENYTINEIAPLYDKFQSDEAFRADICNIISENVDISLTQLEITRDKAQELGIPFQVNEIVELPKKENPMDKAIRLINEYCEKEFGSPGNFSNMDHIELAYKPDEETGLAGIEAYADLETFRIVKEQDGRVVDEQLFNSLDHMNTVLKNLDFDKLIELPDNDKSEIKTTVFENTEKKSPDVSELSVGDVILYDGKRREVEQISENSISLKDLDAPDFGGILLGTSDVLAYNGWQQDMNEKGFEILSKAAPQITSKDHQYVPSQLSLFGEPVVYESDVEEKAIYAALMKGSGFQDGKFRIEEFIKENHSINELAKMLKDEYGTGGHSGNEFYAFANHNSKGIEIILNRKYDNEEGRKIYLSWKEVAERISELVSKGEYITKADIDDRIYHAKYTLKYYDSNNEFDKPYIKKAKNTLKEYGILSENTESSKVIPESEITFTKPDNNSHLKNNIEESDAKNPEENNKPDVPQKITVGDRFRHKITGNISEVVSLTGAFPWITDECTVTRDSGVFSVTENISYNQLLNSDLYEYIDHTDRTVEQAKKSMKSDTKIENFKITGDFIIEGGAKSKFKANSEAIRTLKMIEKENRPATPEEQVILSRYVGWGGLSAAFDSKNEQWSAEYSELKSLLTDEEYNAARASVLDSFYTPPFIIESIYSALENMGFHGGSVLDPSTGTGNFLGKMPGSMSDNSRIYAVEKDSVSGRIAKLLYPDADIQITGFEKRDFSDNFFDVAVGNIPFGGFKISDRRYDKYNFAVHDYFIAKTLDKVRPGGVIAFITSSGTLDKNNPSVRKYISQRAELLGAVRLPNNAFKSYAGTEVTSDIIFLRKREKMIDIAPDWVYTSKNPDGLTINNYFIENPEMILGKVVEGNKLYGKGTMVVPFENSDLKVILNEAVKKIKGNYTAEKSVIAKPSGKKKDKFKPEILPADPTVKNFSYAEIDGKIFYRENSIMTEIPFTGKRYERVSGIAAISKCVRELLNMQLEGYSDEAIISKRTELNQLYDDFTKKNGLLNDKTNRDIFREDVSLPLVLSLEKVKDGKLIGKADIFTKRTLQPPVRITHTDTAADALAVSISEKAGVDLDFMSELMDGKEKSEIISDLKGVIFLNPETSAWETADAYLSGNIRNKLAVAKSAAEPNPDFTENVSALEAAMPDRIEAGDITAKLGSPWIDDKYIQEFMYELFETPKFSRNLGIDNNYIGIQHNPATAKWNVMNKSLDKDNIKSNTAYGTSRKSGYSIFEDSLNMIDTTVYDPVYNPEKDKTEYVINHDETLLARQKQELIENAFREWIFKNPERREYLVEKYNVLYNSIRPREYDGSHLTFAGMNPEITLKKHQKDAVAHALYGGNTLFAHKVGAGKTYEMIAAAMEGKRLGLHNKSLLAVPNHMTEQFANDFLTLYPNANILIAHEDDFKKENRQKLCAKIATGEFDAIIIGHSQLIKIPVSKEREEQFIQDQINELINDIAEMKEQNAESFTVKDMERTKRDYEAKLKKLIEKPIKDDVVTFEEMGVDKLFIDEADMFKNLSVSTKMRNISGVAANRKVQKTQDLYIKCQYLDELTGGKGIVFATGTPVSNSITELFIMQKYLQADYLRESGLTHFDAWAANFAQKVTKLEYAPTGKGFRQKTRLSKFSNLPELMTAFKECADIKTAQDLNLPEPECERHIIAAEPTETQKNLIQSLSERAEKIHNKQVTPDVDNMLKVTTDGIKIGLDQRLINPLLPDEPNTKINMCVNNVTDIWKKTADERLTQVIFCDYSTPKKDAFNLYDDIKSKLIANGIPENEIAFIHDYEKPQDKERLFDKVRNGEIRIVLGSTQKMGAGTNIQNKLYAMHHLDAPWKPRDMEQRLGRMKRQGNMNDKVHEYIYVTKDTFDAYRFQTLETKQGFISQIMTSKNPVRVCEDVSQSEMEFAEVKALCAGNPLIREKMKIDIEVHKLQTLKSAYLNQRYKLEDNVLKHIPESIAKAKENLNAVLADSKITEQNPLKRDGEGNVIFSGMTINDHVYADKKEAGTALIEAAAKALTGNPNARTEIGQYRGFSMEIFFDALSNDIKMDIKGKGGYRITLSSSDTGNLTRIDNAINHIPEKIDEYKSEIEALNTQLENSKAELAKPFLKEQELKTKLTRQSELDRQLNLDNKENLLGKDNVKSFELETEADRQKLNSHNSTQKKNSQSYDLEI